MWENILKQPKANLPHPMVLGDVTQMKRKLKPIPEKPPKKTCMQILQEYGDKLRESEGILGKLEPVNNNPDKRVYRKKISPEENPDLDPNEDVDQLETIYSIVNEIPVISRMVPAGTLSFIPPPTTYLNCNV